MKDDVFALLSSKSPLPNASFVLSIDPYEQINANQHSNYIDKSSEEIAFQIKELEEQAKNLKVENDENVLSSAFKPTEKFKAFLSIFLFFILSKYTYYYH